MTCAKCGGELLRSFVGATEIYLHRYALRGEAHYPRVPTSGPAPLQPPVPPIDGTDEGQPRQPETAVLPEPASPAA